MSVEQVSGSAWAECPNGVESAYVYQPPRPLAEIDADLKAVEAEIAALLGEVTA